MKLKSVTVKNTISFTRNTSKFPTTKSANLARVRATLRRCSSPTNPIVLELTLERTQEMMRISHSDP